MSGTTTTPEEVLQQMERLAQERFGWRGTLELRMRLVEDLGLDSLKAMELAVAIENHFRIRIDEASEEAIISVGDLVAVVCAELLTSTEEE